VETGAFVASSSTKSAVFTWLIITISELTKQNKRPTKSNKSNKKKRKKQYTHNRTRTKQHRRD
jgi:L-asparagine transporter-like permease